MEREDFLSAAIYNNRTFIEEWLEGQPKDAVDVQLLGELLRKAAQYGSASVVELLVTHVDDVNEQIQTEDERTNGWAAIHFASTGYENLESKQANELLLVIYELVAHGANPTLRCGTNHQPKELAQKTGFELGVILLDVAEKMWINNNPDEIAVVDIQQLVNSEKLPALYKNLACWCFNIGKFEILDWIAVALKDSKILDYCLEENDKGMSLYHFAASIGNTLALNHILKHKNPADFVNNKVKIDSTGTCITPLSLMMANNHMQHIMMLVDWDLNALTKLTKLDLSKTNVEVFSLRMLNFSNVDTLILENTKLKIITMEGVLPMPDIKSMPLKHLKASHNQLTELPPELFCLPKLNRLDVSDNQITKLPPDWWQGLVLENLNVSKNKLEEVPLPEVPEDYHPYSGSNHHTLCGRSELIFNELPKVPTHYGVTTQEEFFSPLLTLTLNHNGIKTFPKCLTCCVPVLKHLDLSHNLLTTIPPINELPLSLENLNVSYNKLRCINEGDDTIFRMSFDRKTCAAAAMFGNEYRRCHHKSHTTLPKLCTLSLSHNEKLTKITIHGKLPTVDPDASFSLAGKDTSVHLFFPHLYRLDASHCDLAELPKYFGRMNLVDQLNISYNARLKIPTEVCQLKNLFEFEYKGIDDEETIAQLNKFAHVKEKVQFLNPLYGSGGQCCPPSVKLMFLGSKGHGRSTLLKFLKLAGIHTTTATGPVSSFLRTFYPDWNEEATITQPIASGTSSPPGSLDIGFWNCIIFDGSKVSKKSVIIENSKHVSFCTWCFKGEDKNIQQCFFTASAVYVLCFKATEGPKGIVELEGWLLAIKARASMSYVVIVITHCDQLPKSIKKKELDRIQETIFKLYRRKSKVYPTIHAVECVSCYEGKKDFSDISKLANILYNVAHKVETISSYRANQKIKLLDQNVPKGFADLQQRLTGNRIVNSDNGDQNTYVLTWSRLKQLFKEHLTHLVPPSVHFLDETFMNSVVDDAIVYLINNGTLIHYNSPALSDLYFVDPQWLYDLLASVVTMDYGSSCVWDRGSRRNGKLNRLQLEQTFSDRGLPPDYIGSFIKLLCNFEIAVPLDAETLLIPSLIDDATDKHSHMFRNKYTFPRQDVRKHMADSSAAQGSIYAAKVLPAVAGVVHATRRLNLHTTGLCYRRIVLLHHIPISFWARLLARCLSSASHFYKIILNNCVSDMAFQRLANPGDVVIGQIPCQWIYWKTGITLDFDNRPLLFVSNLVNPNDVDEDGVKKPFGKTVEKIAVMGLFTGREWQRTYEAFSNGFEITVPDYILESWSEDSLIQKRVSYLLSAQIMSHILEVIDEVLKEWFEGDSGLYSSANSVIQQFIPCPHCFGDEKTPEGKQFKDDEVNISLQESSVDEAETTFSAAYPRQRFATVAGTSPMIERNINFSKLPSIVECKEKETELFKRYTTRNRSNSVNSVSWNLGTDSKAGFTFKHCIWAAQHGSTIRCPHHGNLKLVDLIPDVVFRDMLHSTVDKSRLRGKDEVLGKGGFGTVYRVKMYKKESDTLEDVVVKMISTQVHNMSESQSENLDVVVDKYADIRLELNKLCSSSHEYIVHFIGMTIDPLSFILEWAPMGSFRKILVDYRDARCAICPESVLLSIQQISSALNYLHEEKSIVHFDLKPDNVLIFQFPPHGHHCYEPGKPLESLSCGCCKGDGDKPGVLVKLADLGISAFIGPGGFHRKLATPGHTAPEAIRHMGKEQMTEKVDIFSLGVSLYELMTLRELPPEGVHPASFDTELEKGRRPQFIAVDPKYPQILSDCLVSCWSQDYVQRPGARELVYYMKPKCLSLVNSYNLGELIVKDVLIVVTDDNNESLWIASTLKRGAVEEDVLSVYAILESESGPAFKMDVCRTTLKSSILSLCQVDPHFVWIGCQDGSIAVCDIHTRGITKYSTFDDLVKHGQLLKGMRTVGDNKVVVLAYFHGVLGFVGNDSLQTIEPTSSLLQSIDRTMSTDDPLVVTKYLENIGCLYTIEVVDDHEQQVIWCGCDSGTIYVVESTDISWDDNFRHHSLSNIKVTPLKVASFSDKLEAEVNIVQLKSIFNSTLQKTIIYSLHETSEQKSFVISCWQTDQTLQGVIRMDEQVFTLFPRSDSLFVTIWERYEIRKVNPDNSLSVTIGVRYKIHKVNPDNGKTITVLPGYHRASPILTSMCAVMSPTGFLSSIGQNVDVTGATIPCCVLISVGKGCKGPLQNFSQLSDTTLDNTYAILHVVT